LRFHNTKDMSNTLAYDQRNALNAICPYFTMFPLEYPLRVLRVHRKDQPIVMDPFCGRGTTLFAARQLGLQAHGIDSSPVAVAIARAKLCRVDTEATLKLAQSYIDANQKWEQCQLPSSFGLHLSRLF
jgi:DNA modification methylase